MIPTLKQRFEIYRSNIPYQLLSLYWYLISNSQEDEDIYWANYSKRLQLITDKHLQVKGVDLIYNGSLSIELKAHRKRKDHLPIKLLFKPSQHYPNTLPGFYTSPNQCTDIVLESFINDTTQEAYIYDYKALSEYITSLPQWSTYSQYINKPFEDIPPPNKNNSNIYMAHNSLMLKLPYDTLHSIPGVILYHCDFDQQLNSQDLQLMKGLSIYKEFIANSHIEYKALKLKGDTIAKY